MKPLVVSTKKLTTRPLAPKQEPERKLLIDKQITEKSDMTLGLGQPQLSSIFHEISVKTPKVKTRRLYPSATEAPTISPNQGSHSRNQIVIVGAHTKTTQLLN